MRLVLLILLQDPDKGEYQEGSGAGEMYIWTVYLKAG